MRGRAARFVSVAALAVAAVGMPHLASAASTLPAYTVIQPVGPSNVSLVAVDPATHRVYVASGPNASVVVIDGLTRSVLATIAVPFGPSSVAIDSATHRLFILGALVTHNPPKATSSLAFVDTTTNAIITTVPVPYLQGNLAVDLINHHVLALPSSFDEQGKSLPNPPPIGRADVVAIDPAIQRLYVMNVGAGAITVYNSTTYKWVANVTVSVSSGAIAVDPLTHAAYVSDAADGLVSVINGTTDAVTATIPVGNTPGAIAIDAGAGLVYVSKLPNIFVESGPLPAGTVTVIDATSNTVLTDVALTGTAGGIAVDSVTHSVWLASNQVNELSPVVSRRSGVDRFGTATGISGAAYDPRGADAVVLARSDTYPDALVGAPFAASKNAPLLYTSGASLPAETSAEITRVLAPGKTVYLLGGTSAIPASVATQLTGMGYVVTRLSGTDRYATAVAVADAMGDPSVVFLATAGNYADALAAGPAAASAKGAILLTAGATLPAETSTYLQAHPGSVYAVGGPAAAADPSASVISGGDRYGTAALVATQFFPSPTTVGLASGTTFADALPAAAYLARVGGPLLLTDPNTLPAPAQTYLVAAQSTVTSALVFGGTSAISTAAQTAFSTALGR